MDHASHVNPDRSTAVRCGRKALTSLFGGYLRQIGECGAEFGLVMGAVFELAGLEIDIGLHVEMTMTAKVEQNRA